MANVASENIKYLRCLADGAVYRVNFSTRKYALVKTDHDMGILPDVKGGFKKGGFEGGHFVEVPSPLR